MKNQLFLEFFSEREPPQVDAVARNSFVQFSRECSRPAETGLVSEIRLVTFSTEATKLLCVSLLKSAVEERPTDALVPLVLLIFLFLFIEFWTVLLVSGLLREIIFDLGIFNTTSG